MGRFAQQIDYYLEMFRQGNSENAFHGLLELDHDILPELIAVFRGEQDIALRELLLEVIWQYREHSVVPLLGEALRDTQPRIWRQALNGLVALASPEALDILRAARTQQFPTARETEEFRHWLNEAIEQAATEAREA